MGKDGGKWAKSGKRMGEEEAIRCATGPGIQAWRGQVPREPIIHSTISGGVIPYQGLIVAALGHRSKAPILRFLYRISIMRVPHH